MPPLYKIRKTLRIPAKINKAAAGWVRQPVASVALQIPVLTETATAVEMPRAPRKKTVRLSRFAQQAEHWRQHRAVLPAAQRTEIEAALSLPLPVSEQPLRAQGALRKPAARLPKSVLQPEFWQPFSLQAQTELVDEPLVAAELETAPVVTESEPVTQLPLPADTRLRQAQAARARLAKHWNKAGHWLPCIERLSVEDAADVHPVPVKRTQSVRLPKRLQQTLYWQPTLSVTAEPEAVAVVDALPVKNSIAHKSPARLPKQRRTLAHWQRAENAVADEALAVINYRKSAARYQ
jgi:hypothetical protein